MKKLLLLLFFVPLFTLGQSDFASEFVFNNEFVDADKELTTNKLLEAYTTLELSEAERREIYETYRQNFRLIVKKSSDDASENINIIKSEFTPSWELLDLLKSKKYRMLAEELLPEGVSIELLDSGIKTLYGKYTYLYLNNVTTKFNEEYYSNIYYISINKKNFQININTSSNLKLEDVISYIKP